MADQAQGLRKLVEKMGRAKPSLHMTGSRVVAITSGKGGVGKSNLAVNLALALKEYGKKVLVFDADLGLGNVDVIMGIIPPFTLTHVVRGERGLQDIIVSEYGINLIAGGSGVEELLDLPDWQLRNFLSQLQQLEDVSDYVLFDTGAGINRHVLGFVLAATDIIVVTTPEPTAITDAYALLKVIASKNRDAVVRLLVNRVVNAQEARQVVRKLRLVAREFLSLELCDFGYILEDASISRAVKAQKPFLYAYPRSPASQCLRQVAKNFLAGEGTLAKGDKLTSFFQRMLGLFRR
ncbi:MAG: MinD/ParA family protein [bacterium]|jgi:flagellar biosynthesis protein FlhG|nr:MinD/ParA family protein [Bacillota bacterium]